MVYDDRLRDHDSVESLMQTAEAIAEELAEDHFAECYDGELCGACSEDTPISGEWGPWLGKKTEFDGLVSCVEDRVRAIQGGEAYWVTGELSGTYLEAFRAAAVDPAECVVCTRQIIEDAEECGHERYGEDCPVDY